MEDVYAIIAVCTTLFLAFAFAGELNDALELLAYAYHTGENYTDRDDLEMKYYEHLDCDNERWEFLP